MYAALLSIFTAAFNMWLITLDSCLISHCWRVSHRLLPYFWFSCQLWLFLIFIICKSDRFTVDGRSGTVVASSDSVPSAEADEEVPEQELMEESMNDKRVNELWMDFEVLFKCFRSDSYWIVNFVIKLRNVIQQHLWAKLFSFDFFLQHSLPLWTGLLYEAEGSDAARY